MLPTTLVSDTTLIEMNTSEQQKQVTLRKRHVIPRIISGESPTGIAAGGNTAEDFGLSTVENPAGDSAGGCAPVALSLSHNSEQLVFQKPIFSCSRSYVTKVLRTTIPV